MNPLHFIYLGLISAALLFGWNRFNKWMDLKYQIAEKEALIEGLEKQNEKLNQEMRAAKQHLKNALNEITKWESQDGKIKRAENFNGAIDRLGIGP